MESMEELFRRIIREELMSVINGDKKDDKTPIYYTVSEAADVLRVSRVTIYNLHNKGKLEFYKIGGRTLINSCELHDSISNNLIGKYMHYKENEDLKIED